MPHIRESILDAVQAALATLPSSPVVTRATVYPAVLPSVNILQGADERIDLVDAVEHVMNIELVVSVAAVEGEVDQALNALDAEIYPAMLTVTTPGLIDAWWLSLSEPELAPDDADAAGVVARAVIVWRAQYRHSAGDPTVAA